MRLETIQIGCQMFTSVDALQRFAEALTGTPRRREEPESLHRTAHIAQDVEKIVSALDVELGCEVASTTERQT